MSELIKRLERVIAAGVPDKNGQHPISAEAVLEVVKELSEHGTDLAEVGADCISRQSAIDAFNTNLNELVVGGEENAKTVENYLNRVLDKIKCLPSAQPEIVRCKDCKHFEYDHVENINGIPLIVAHEICMRWSDGVKTSENGYCFLAERREVTE